MAILCSKILLICKQYPLKKMIAKNKYLETGQLVRILAVEHTFIEFTGKECIVWKMKTIFPVLS